MLVQPSRTATVCEVDRARKRAASLKRAQNLGYQTNHWRLAPGNDPLTLTCSCEDCSALRPAHLRRHQYVTCYTEGFSHFVTCMTSPVGAGSSGPDRSNWKQPESAALSRR